jgi:hypothetical protein
LESLASSNTAASQEVDAVVSQIESSMSSQQVSSITAMKLTQSDLAATAASTPALLQPPPTPPVRSRPARLKQQAGAPSGGNPPSDMSGGMPGGTDVQSISQAQTGTSSSGGCHAIGRYHEPGIRGHDQSSGRTAPKEESDRSFATGSSGSNHWRKTDLPPVFFQPLHYEHIRKFRRSSHYERLQSKCGSSTIFG